MRRLSSLAAALALGALAWPAARAADDARALEIVQGKCFICHGEQGESSSPLSPRLAGQHALYGERQLQQFNQRERSNDNAVMHAVAVKLTELERKAVAAYVAGLR